MDLTPIENFCKDHRVTTKGSLAAALQLNRLFSQDGFPIDVNDYVTEKEGQVKGISKDNCQKILSEYGITRLLAAEGGRTSRGTMALMRNYAKLINSLHPDEEQFTEIEKYWIQKIQAFFIGKPLTLESDSSLSVSAAFEHLLAQAKQRQSENPGTMYVGTVLQQLVAAKLTLILPEVEINGASVADDPTGRGGDFNVGDTAIHCTTAPASLLMEKCRHNISEGLHPVIITIRDRVKTAWDLAADSGIADRLEVWDVQSFLSSNVYEHGLFSGAERSETLSRLIVAYNKIIDKYETDPSLRITYK